jgi:hypothetical protein
MPYRDDFAQASIKAGRQHVYNTMLRGSDHQAFCDVWMICNSRLLSGVLGSVDPVRTAAGLDQITLDFFTASCRMNSNINDLTCNRQSQGPEDNAQSQDKDTINSLAEFVGTGGNPHTCHPRQQHFIQHSLTCYSEFASQADYTSFDRFNSTRPRAA